MPSVHRQENNIVPAIRGCAKSAAPDVLYAVRIDVYFILGRHSTVTLFARFRGLSTSNPLARLT